MFMRTKIVKGKEYKSWESRKRVNGKVVSIYHGPVHLPGERAAAIAMAKVDAHQRSTFGETGAELKAREAEAGKFHQGNFLAQTQSAQPTASETVDTGAKDAVSANAGETGEGESGK